jgi:hypothetical protein
MKNIFSKKRGFTPKFCIRTIDEWLESVFKYPDAGDDHLHLEFLHQYKHSPGFYLKMLPNLLDEVIKRCIEIPELDLKVMACIRFKDFYKPKSLPNLSTFNHICSYIDTKQLPCIYIQRVNWITTYPNIYDFCQDIGNETWFGERFRVIYCRRFYSCYQHFLTLFSRKEQFTPLYKNIDWENIPENPGNEEDCEYPIGWNDPTQYIMEIERLKKESWQRRDEEDEKKRHKIKKRRKMRMLPKNKPEKS